MQVFNVILAASIIALAAWVSRRNPTLGGFIVSLPLSTLIVLVINRQQNQDPASSVALAKSIFVAVPATLVFFVPFLLAERLKLSFWTCYGSGVALLSGSFFVHRAIMRLLAG
jgi:hypothetical protein